MGQSNKKKKIRIGTSIVLLVAGFVFVSWWVFFYQQKEKVVETKNKHLRQERVADFHQLAEKVIVEKDIIYSTQYGERKLDVYMPKANFGSPKPTIFWAHGGAFIAGDKKNTADYSTMLASQGYVVVNMNYSLAPDYQYPTPILQVGDAYLYIMANQHRFDADLQRVAFGGDSAGGQIVGQFVNVQVDHEYADKVDLEPVVKDPDTIKSVVFFSALLDINQYDENENEHVNDVFNQSAQAYFGLRHWKNSTLVNNANIVGNVSEAYPPTYLTDGNTASFQTQAEVLHDLLNSDQVPVQATFFPKEQVELRHQYQFRFSLKEAVENYHELSEFLDTYLKRN